MDDNGGTSGSKIDLSSVPEPMRSMLLRQLDKMPTQMREQLLREGSPLLDRVIAKARERAGAGTAALPASAARTNAAQSDPVRGNVERIQTVRHGSGEVPTRTQTVSPGDRANGGAWLVVIGIALAITVFYALRG